MKRIGLNSPVVLLFLFVVVVQVLSLYVAAPVHLSGEMQAFEEPGSILNVVFFMCGLVAASVFILLMIRFRLFRFLRMFYLVVAFLTISFTLYPFFLFFNGLSLVLTLGVSFLLTWALYVYPEWYVVDLTGVLMASGISSLMGISMTILPVIILLFLSAVYDLVAVNVTGHMIDLASSAFDLRLPAALVVPRRKGFSLLKAKPLKETLKGEERSFIVLGLGDVVFPALLTVSCWRWLPPERMFLGVPSNLFVAMGCLTGSLIGLSLLLLSSKGKPRPGLPFLNTGVIVGYLAFCLVAYGMLIF